ncbi:Protein kinase domain [Quillaja saponaria]|uniref:RING-type E3 ubiquitin transferase n=1 Tax=Quillaja saponaria TaxID=32244 RepID=A0AAD7QDM6_QUISA|nr:Protein kinase domain [Quillaja saponaria]
MRSVAVAVNGTVTDGGRGRGSRRAFRWAVENLMSQADRFILVHVMPKINSIPTPSGQLIPITELDANMVALYVKDVKIWFEQIFIPFKKLCNTKTMETLLLEDDNPATALLSFIAESGIQTIVLGSCSSNFIVRMLRGVGLPTTVLRCTLDTCDIYIVSKKKIISKLANSSPACETSSTHRDNRDGCHSIDGQPSQLSSSSTEPKVDKIYGVSSLSEFSYFVSQSSTYTDSFTNPSINHESYQQNSRDEFVIITADRTNSTASISGQSVIQEEMERLKLELRNTVAAYKQVCEELVHAQNKVRLLSSECFEEAGRVNAAQEREETSRQVAAEEKAKHLNALKELEEATNSLVKESYERQLAELNALKESIEKKKIVDVVFLNDKRYRKYTRDEIEVATDFFSEANMIGEGGYGKVYKCSLDHTPVAVKVLRQDAMHKKEEFLKEVEILSQLRHPHMVLLLGACPEICCLVYEYMENGSLEDYISYQNGKQPLPWFIRFRIVFEIACGLSFLHNSKPEPVVHRDLKPGNILLDKHFVSKIGDVGLAKLLSDVVPDNITEYTETLIAGTIHYMDPEYQRTGTIRPKSDLYALGVITLQLLTARRPHGLILAVENAIRNGSFPDILDKSIGDWPLGETMELAQIALRCLKLRCKDRPDLETEVFPILKRLHDVANASAQLEQADIFPPSHYYCPILQEIIDDPYIAADGFTYEYRAIKAWLGKHNVSPVTKVRLQNSMLTPNHTLRSSIQEWKSRMVFSSTSI